MLPYAEMSSDYAGAPVVFASFPQSHFLPREHIQSPQSHWMPAAAEQPAPAPAPSNRPRHSSNTSRKRSRDESEELDPASLLSPDDGTLTGMDVVEEPIMGEGMTLIDPKTGRTLTAESQTGTWYEDQLEEERRAAAEAAAALEQEKLDAQGRPSKTVRLQSPNPGAAGELVIQQPLAATPMPQIDSASMMLGIGWKEVSADPDIASAARGWARYIENHYTMLGQVEILCKSEGQQAFLVKAGAPQESWWLFKDDLSEGKLVATSLEACIHNLRAQPPIFESDMSIFAANSPAASQPTTTASTPLEQGMPNGFAVANGGAGAALGGGDNMMFD